MTMKKAKFVLGADGDGDGVERGGMREIKVDLRFEHWGIIREEALKSGKRGVKGYVEALLVEHVGEVLLRRDAEKDGSLAAGGEGDTVADRKVEAAEKKSRRETQDRIEEKINEWVYQLLESGSALDALPDNAKASLIMSRLPKVGLSRGEIEEKAFGLVEALKGLPDVEDMQGEMVTLREELARVDNERRVVEKELLLVLETGETADGEKAGELARRFARLSLAWREMIREALVGREQASVCGMLKEGRLLEIWTTSAMGIAKEVLGAKVVEEHFLGVKEEFN